MKKKPTRRVGHPTRLFCALRTLNDFYNTHTNQRRRSVWPGSIDPGFRESRATIVKRKSFDDAGHVHFLTFTCYRRQQLLTDPIVCRIITICIDQARTRCDFKLYAWVLMPEHVHLLIHPVDDKYRTSKILKFIKAPAGRKIIAYWREHAPHMLHHVRVGSRKNENRFWQAGGGFDRNLFELDRIRKAIDYIEYNPVRRGLVAAPSQWRCSSAARMRSGDTLLETDEIELF